MRFIGFLLAVVVFLAIIIYHVTVWAAVVGLIASLSALFIVGSAGFYVFFCIAVCLMIWAIEEENGLATTVCMAVTILALNFLSGVPIFALVKNHILLTILYIVGYLVAGAIYSVVKWYFYTKNLADRYDERRQTFLKNNRISGDEIPKEHKEAWARVKQSESLMTPRVDEHKAQLMLWMSYWPLSGLWTLINDPLRRAWRFLYARLQGTYESIAQRNFQHTQKDALTPEEQKELGLTQQARDEENARYRKEY